MPWEIDKTRTRLEFSVRHMMIHTVRGGFSDYEVDLDIDPADLTKGSAFARIETESVSTKDSIRDEYLVSENFFNPRVYPYMEYKSTSVRHSGRQISVSGLLKIRDKENPLLLTGTVTGPYERFGSRRLTFDLTGEVEREPYDMVFHGAVESVSIVVGKKVNLQLRIELVES